MRPDERRNAIVYASGEGIWGLGMGLVAPLTVLPLMVKAMGGGPIEIGLLYSMVTAGFLLTQPIGMVLLQHGTGRKRFLLLYHIVVVPPICVLIAAVIFCLSPGHRGLSRVLFLILFSIRVLAIGIVIPIWMDWVAGLFTVRSRGRATGMAAGAWAMGVSATALVAGWITQQLPFRWSYSLLFILSAVCFLGSMAAFSLVGPGVSSSPARRLGVGELVARFGQSLAQLNFRNYLVARILLTMGSGATAFFAVHYRSADGGSVSAATVIALGAFLTLPQAFAGYALGKMGDELGHKVGVFLGAAAQIAAILVAVVFKGGLACAVCFSLVGVAVASGWVSHQNMIYETCSHDSRVAHITLSNLVLSPFVASVPLLTGWLVQHLGRINGILLCLVPTCLGALWLLVAVREPRQVELPVFKN